ncbi:MAG: hypothetical protein R3F43_26645 [bacterium]
METADTSGALPPPSRRDPRRGPPRRRGRPSAAAALGRGRQARRHAGGRFVLDERLGEDGVGTAWQAVDERSGKRIVILLFNPAIANDRATTEKLRAAVKTATASTTATSWAPSAWARRAPGATSPASTWTGGPSRRCWSARPRPASGSASRGPTTSWPTSATP